jgi:hypothetical protein
VDLDDQEEPAEPVKREEFNYSTITDLS